MILFLIQSPQQAVATALVLPAQALQQVGMVVLGAVLLAALVVQVQAVQEIHQAQAQAKVTMAVVRVMQWQVEAVVLQEVALVP
jgi:hypothetical protein